MTFFEEEMGHNVQITVFYCGYCDHTMEDCEYEGCFCDRCCFTEIRLDK